MSQRRLLLRDIHHLVLGDACGTRLRGVDLLIDGPRVVDIGPHLPPDEAEVVDCSTKLVVPGLVNVHHHMFQLLQRNVAAFQNVGLFEWLQGLYHIWQGLTPEALHVATQLACAELLKTGCTTTADHHYLFPRGLGEDLVGLQLEAAGELGIRFCAMRGSMSLGQSAGGLPPDNLTEAEDVILADSEQALRHHDSDPFSLRRVALAPCAPFNVSALLMQQTAALARQHGVRLHTHLAETLDEQQYCRERHGCRPLELMEQWGWLGPDVWFAHGIHFHDDELDLLASTGTGIAHCATSNMRLGSGICRVPELLDRGVLVGLGVDGSASNDSSDMVGELRTCMLLHRVRSGADAMSAEQCLTMATRNGARLLGWDRIGSLEVGQAADVAVFELDRLDYAGALSDPLAALLFCGISHQVDMTVVNGVVVVRDGHVLAVDEQQLCQRANSLAKQMLTAAGHSTKWMP